VFALTGDRAAAEDLVQEVLEHLYVAWPRVDDPAAYARRALVNRGTNRWRQRVSVAMKKYPLVAK
jgi:DNA-directed RNA polymerase specialized sigma24 family protein